MSPVQLHYDSTVTPLKHLKNTRMTMNSTLIYYGFTYYILEWFLKLCYFVWQNKIKHKLIEPIKGK